MTISTLIDKQDTFEIIRDQIALILRTEITNQQLLAVAAAKDPNLWALRIFTERSNPWEQWQDAPDADTTPIVNVWYDNSNFNPNASNSVESQKATATYNIDCYALGLSKSDVDGHIPGDKDAALTVHRVIRLVRNILMAGHYTYLGLRGTVWNRWPQSVTIFQPQLDALQVQQIIGARLQLLVGFSETSPQYEGQILEQIHVDILRSEDGEILLSADYT